MKDKGVFFNPFRMLSPKLDSEALRIERLHEEPVSESVTLEKGLLMMISKIIEATRILSKLAAICPDEEAATCEALLNEVRQQEKMLTMRMVGAEMEPGLRKSLIRFPFRMERIGDALSRILNCFRVKTRDGIPFTDVAFKECDEMFRTMADTMTNLRDAIVTPNKVLLDHIMSQGKNLVQMVEDFKLDHWERLEAGFCAPQASTMYRDILDSIKTADDYLVKMSAAMLEMDAAQK